MVETITVCSKCGTINRLPISKPAANAKCGKCKDALFCGHPEDVGQKIFERQIARNTLPTLVDVWAPWCGPCQTMAPAYEAAAKELEPKVRLIKLNAEREQGIAQKLGIRGIPCLMLFSNGRELARSSGVMSSKQIVEWTQGVLSKNAE